MKYYVIAGEKSGDLHAANLLREIRKLDAQAQFRGFGGDDMQAQGMEIIKHYRDLAFMGFLEVVKNLRTIFRNIEFCQQDILAFKPDAIILVDYPGFNLKIAEFAKKQGFKVFYYISPKIWAWNTKRALKIKRFVDRMFVIFPFEVNFYKQFDYDVEFVGNPLLDAIANFKADPDFLAKNQLSDKPIIALLPGSRRQELEKILPDMVSVVSEFPDYEFIIAGVSDFEETYYQQIFAKAGFTGKIKIVFDQTYDLLSHATAALVTSGTATLETSLFEVPQVVCYKTSGITYAIAKNLIKVPYISLVNLVGEKKIVTELIQQHLNTKEITLELRKILPSAPERQIQLNDYKILKERLSVTGASETTARLIVNDI
jgi:lipid-A-disaccharide synthase